MGWWNWHRKPKEKRRLKTTISKKIETGDPWHLEEGAGKSEGDKGR